jgi:hypothetical protein
MFKLSLASFEEFSSLLHEAVEKITAKRPKRIFLFFIVCKILLYTHKTIYFPFTLPEILKNYLKSFFDAYLLYVIFALH